MSDTRPPRCHGERDYPDCLGESDDRFIMRFDDIGEPPIHWCPSCGLHARAMNALLDEAFATRPGFAAELTQAMDDAEARAQHEREKLH